MIGGFYELRENLGYNNNAASVNISLGYHINSKISFGIGSGYDRFDTPIIPLYLDLKGDLLKSSVTPFYKLSAGYGFVSPTKQQKDNPNLSQSGGILIHPSIGIKFHTRFKAAWLLDFGYRIQRFNQEFDFAQNPQRWTLRRATVRFGLEF